MGVIPNPKMAFIFPISCILVLVFPISINFFSKCEGKSSFRKSQIKSLNTNDPQKKYRLGTVSKNILLEGLNQLHSANLTLSSDVDQDT